MARHYVVRNSSRCDLSLRYRASLLKWNFYIDDTRNTALIVAPLYKPRASRSRRFKGGAGVDFVGLGPLRQVGSASGAPSGYFPLPRSQSQQQSLHGSRPGRRPEDAEEFASDWLLKTDRLPPKATYLVKVYFADEPDIPFPENKTLKDFSCHDRDTELNANLSTRS